MATRLESYLRMYRRRAGLSQSEIAVLIDVDDRRTVSRHEQRDRDPDLRTLLAYEVLYGHPVAELFAGVRDEVELSVLTRAQALHEHHHARGAALEETLRSARLVQELKRRWSATIINGTT